MTSGWHVTQVLPLCELPLNLKKKKKNRVRKKEVVIDSPKLGFHFLKTCIVHVLNVHRSIEEFLFVSLGNA